MTATSKVDRLAHRRAMAESTIEAELRALPVLDAQHVLLSLTERWLPEIREAARREFARTAASTSTV